MKSPAALTPILRVFGHRQYALFMGGMTPELVTLWMQRVGIGWLAWELTGSPTWLGIIAAADLVPVMLLAPIAGVYTDRQDPLVQQRIAQALNMLQAATLAALTFAGVMNIWLLFLLVLAGGLVHPFATTSRHAIVPATVPRADFATAIALDSTLFNASRFVGPALAGIMIPFTGVGGTFFVNAFSCLFFLCMLFLMKVDFTERAHRKRRKMLGDIAESLSYVRAHVGIGPLFVVMCVLSVCMRPVQDMLPGFSGAVFDAGAQGLAWLTSSMGVGAMIAAGWIAMRGRITGLTTTILIGTVGLGLATLGFVATAELWVAVIFGALSGFMLNMVSTSTQALTQSALTDDLRGRVMGVYTVIYRGMPAFGALAVGILAEWFGLRWTFAGAALTCFAVWAWVLPRYRVMERSLETERPAGPGEAAAGRPVSVP